MVAATPARAQKGGRNGRNGETLAAMAEIIRKWVTETRKRKPDQGEQ